MENSLLAAVEAEMIKSAGTVGSVGSAVAEKGKSLLESISPMLLGGAGAGLLGTGAGALLTKRRKGPDGEEEDGSKYRKRVLRNAAMLGGLGAVGGVGGGAFVDSMGKYLGGTPGKDGKIPERQGSELGNLFENILASPGAAVGAGAVGNVFTRKVLKPGNAAADTISSQHDLAKNLKGMGLGGLDDSGKVTNPKQFESAFRDKWNRDESFRRLVDSKLQPGTGARFYRDAGLTDPNSSLFGSIRDGFSKLTGGRVAPYAGKGPANKLDGILTGLQRGNVSRKLFGRGKGRGPVAAVTGLTAILPSYFGTYVDDLNK